MGNASAIMVDIETMDTGPKATILSIGACAFDINNPNEEITDIFEARISIESNAKAGRSMSASTIEWWLKQDKAAQEALFKPPIMNLRSALTEFRMWVDRVKPRPTRIWAKDPDFDCVILIDAFKQTGEMWPFKYWDSRSVRTITEVAYPEGNEPAMRVGVHHSAADDAVTQAMMVRHCWAKLGNTPL